MTYRCGAIQYSDQMVCESCRTPKGRPLTWDVNDPDPPPCRQNGQRRPPTLMEVVARARQALDDRQNETMVSEGTWAAIVRGLLLHIGLPRRGMFIVPEELNDKQCLELVRQYRERYPHISRAREKANG